MSTLAQELAARKKDSEDTTCAVQTGVSHALGFVEFFDSPQSPQSRQGFALAHLLHYRLAASVSPLQPEGAAGAAVAEAPAQVLTLAFSTADVVVTGWRLERITQLLQEGKLSAVKTIPHRHIALTGSLPAVVAIAIRPVSPSQSAD